MAKTAEEMPLETRLRAIEDRLEIYHLIASHPPNADTAADFYTEAVYLEDGVFDRGEGLSGAVGAQEIGAITQTPEHQHAIDAGIAHFAGLPIIEIDGNTATVTSYLQLLYPDTTGEDRELPNHGFSCGYRVHRVVANRWDLLKTDDGWKISRRTLRPLDDTKPGRAILSQALDSYRPVK